MDVQDLTAQFVMITSATASEADSYLEMCDWDMERAVNMYMENHPAASPAVPDRLCDAVNDGDAPSGASSSLTPGEEVRAPIPQRSEVLVESPFFSIPAFSMRRSVATNDRAPAPFHQPSQSWSVFDEPRPEAEPDEEIQITAVVPGRQGPERRGRKRNLAQLFCPPYELIHQGPFDSARELGMKQNKWLLVDVQDSKEFLCQCLNRDLWKNETVAGVLKANFIFWQVNILDPMGQRFQQFYPVTSLPFVGLVDPTTGELLETFRRLSSASEFIEDVYNFLSKNPNPTCNKLTLSPAAKRARREETSGEGRIVAQVNDMKIDEAGLSEMTEEEQLRLAMERSREQFMDSGSSLTTAPSELAAQLTDSDTTDSLPQRDPSPIGPLPSVEEEERAAAAIELEETIRKAHNPSRLCRLVVRLPQGEREMVTLPASAPIKCLKLFVESHGYSMQSNELVALYPTRNLSHMKAFASLESAKLFPKDTVFVQEK